MEIQYFGGNCVRIATKKATLVVDDKLKELGQKSVAKSDDILLFTGDHEPVKSEKIIIDQPGEYEASDVSVTGIAARAHIDESGAHATIYKIETEDFRIAIIGHIYPSLTEDQLEKIGTIDILIIPVGGHGFTLDGAGALQVIKKIEPKVVIPTHYADKALKYEVPAEELDVALKAMAMEPQERLEKLKLKGGETFGGDQTQLIVLERQ